MTPNCSQPLTNGQPCSAPAVHGSRFCRHHDPQRPPKPVKEDENEPLALPPLIDKPSILIAINEVAHALAAGRIKRSVAETLLFAIKLANRLVTEIEEAGLSEVLHELPVGQIDAPTPLDLETARAAKPDSNVRNGAVALAASADRANSDGLFSAAYASPAVDPSTAGLVRELVAQSHQLAKSQNLRANI